MPDSMPKPVRETTEVGRRVRTLERVAQGIWQATDRATVDGPSHEARQKELNDACMGVVKAMARELSVHELGGSSSGAKESAWAEHERVRKATFGALSTAIDHRLEVNNVGLLFDYLVVPLSMPGNRGRLAPEQHFVAPLRDLVRKAEEGPPPLVSGSAESSEDARYVKGLQILEERVVDLLFVSE